VSNILSSILAQSPETTCNIAGSRRDFDLAHRVRRPDPHPQILRGSLIGNIAKTSRKIHGPSGYFRVRSAQNRDDPSFWHRCSFGLRSSITTLFPQLTMGLAFMIVLLEWQAFLTPMSVTRSRARFLGQVFGVTSCWSGHRVPMDFQFGTNWARFLALLLAGVIGRRWRMEGMFAFSVSWRARSAPHWCS